MDDFKITMITCECGQEVMIMGRFGHCEKCCRQHHIHHHFVQRDDGICDVGGGPCE